MRRACALGLAWLLGGALALTLYPTDAQLRQEIRRGLALADQRQGYPVQAYVVYSVPDALTLERGEGSVEAVQIATPLERARWGSYFLAIQGKAVTPEAVERQANLPAGELAVIIYAHSAGKNDEDKDFLRNFSPLRLTLNGHTRTPAKVESFGPSLNNYRDADGRVVFRWTDTLTARFDLAGLSQNAANARGHLQFTDASGKSYDLPLDLRRVR